MIAGGADLKNQRHKGTPQGVPTTALFWSMEPDGRARCALCPHGCLVEPGGKGLCGARAHDGEGLVAENYGRVTSIALDPIEKKPLRHFCPGGQVLSIGSYGCNLRCGFCQNHEISMGEAPYRQVTPEDIARESARLAGVGNIGVAYTYNEPLIGYEFVHDCAALIRAQGQKNVLVTNGYISPEPLAALLPLVDAVNIDLKGFTEGFYRAVGGSLEPVLHAIRAAAAVCHVEVTTLVIPGMNGAEAEMDAEAAWLASVDPAIPLHISRFFPCYRMAGAEPTPIPVIRGLVLTARRHLRHVYPGNCPNVI